MNIVITLLGFFILQLVHCSCPDGFDLVCEGQCRGKYATISKPWDEILTATIAKCNEIQGQPVIIHSDDDQSYWKGQAPSRHDLALGLVCNSSSKKWEWVDGSPLDYKPPKGHFTPGALDERCTNGCSWLLNGTGYWTRGCGRSSTLTVDIFCTTQLTPPSPAEDGCDSFEDDVDDAVCYQIGATAGSWREAQRICRNFGAELATIHTAKANSFIRRLAVSKSKVNGLFLGAMSGSDNKFEWIDGSAWNYNNFYPGFPMNGLGNCLAMDTQGTSGQWVNTDCSSKQSVACERPQHYPVPDCSSGPWKEGDIIFSPGFPFDASTPCDFMLSVDEGKRVEVEILLLEANSCCDHLVLFEDYISGKVIANLTGEINEKTYTTESSNFMRVSWQPNGGVNVRGILMTFRGV